MTRSQKLSKDHLIHFGTHLAALKEVFRLLIKEIQNAVSL